MYPPPTIPLRTVFHKDTHTYHLPSKRFCYPHKKEEKGEAYTFWEEEAIENVIAKVLNT